MKFTGLNALLILILTFPVIINGCAEKQPENITEKINQLIAEDEYERALSIVQNADTSRTDADIPTLKEKIHLNYGLYLEYRGPEESSMRKRMTSALEQYIEVLRINPENEKARAEIEQIMGIYQTMPDRSPGEEILENLRELGFDY